MQQPVVYFRSLQWSIMNMTKLFILLSLLGTLGLLLGGCSRHSSGPQSDHYDGRYFFNPGKPMDKGFVEFMKWRLTSKKNPWPQFNALESYDIPPNRVNGDTLRISYVGHATVLLQTQGLNILTDPVWSHRASPISWAGPQRVHPPGITFDNLPSIDVVLLSHNHYDHMDLASIEEIWNRFHPRILVPLGNDTIITAHNSSIAVEPYDWGARIEIAEQAFVHLEPMHHWSARGIFDRNKALWAAFTINTEGGNIYFVGDSGYGNGDYFRAAREKFGSFRLAVLPIGAYEPPLFMAYSHMNPQDAVLAFEDLGCPYVLPIHHMTFPLADTGYREPLDMLEQELRLRNEAQSRFVPLMAGKSWLVPEDETEPQNRDFCKQAQPQS